jgi:long-chain-fatty-acid--[acyl-carrier-protein] ligase
MSHLARGLKPQLSPLVYSGTYRVPFLLPLMKLVQAHEVPDLAAQSRSAASRTQELIDSIVERVQAGDSFIIYPSGRLQRTNREVIGSARFVHELVSRCPELQVVLVRTSGLWGSLWGCARGGQPPDLTKTVLQATGWLLASLVVFLPRRRVHLHVEPIARERLPLEVPTHHRRRRRLMQRPSPARPLGRSTNCWPPF